MVAAPHGRDAVSVLRDPATIRRRCAAITQAVSEGRSAHFKLDRSRLDEVAAWIDTYRQRLTEGMVGNGYPAEFADAIFRQIEGFGEYGFPESHAASFALIVYSSSWLKTHHPGVFAAASRSAPARRMCAV